MVLHKYRVSWKKEGIETEFTTIVAKDFPAEMNEVQRAIDIHKLVNKLKQYEGLKILRIKEMV